MARVWAEVKCEVPAVMVDALSEYLVELSSTGVSIDNLVLDAFSLEAVEESPVKTVTAYFTDDEDLDGILRGIETFLVENGPAFPGFVYRPPKVGRIKEEDWSASWKDHFRPQRIGNHLVVKPTWEELSTADGDIVLELDPGMAFGTGTHPTTRLCLAILESLLSTLERRSAGRLTVLDVGTGSGILAIAAARLGAAHVEAVDVDPEAVRAAKENSALNRVSQVIAISDTPLGSIHDAFDIVLANILAEDLVRMSNDLVERTNPNGFLILSGILSEKEDLVLKGYSHAAVTLVEIVREDEWSCFVYRRNV